VIDIREAILARLLEIVAGIPNIRWAERNNVDWPDDQLPAVMILDGDEESLTSDIESSRQPDRPGLVQMTPEITFVEQANEVGSDLSTLRREVLKLILRDSTILELIAFPTGNLRYLGCQTDLAWGRAKQGMLYVHFAIKYPLKIEEL
jgi:hypothetical protein